MTIWGVAGIWIGFVAYGVAWLRGGRPERFAAGVLILHCMVATIVFKWEIGGLHLPRMMLDYVRLLIFGWLCFRSNRWWPFVAMAATGPMAGLDVATVLNPAFYMASASAHVGLGYLLDLSLLLGVGERVLAGEAPARRAAWARADAAAATRRERRRPTRRFGYGRDILSKGRSDGTQGRRPRLPA